MSAMDEGHSHYFTEVRGDRLHVLLDVPLDRLHVLLVRNVSLDSLHVLLVLDVPQDRSNAATSRAQPSFIFYKQQRIFIFIYCMLI